MESNGHGSNGKLHDLSTLPPLGAPASGAGEIRQLVARLLELLGEDPSREGLAQTPRRVEETLRFLTGGYTQDVDAVLNGAFYDAPEAAGVVTFQDVGFYSMCEHHLLPFYGKCYVAYLPSKKVIGLSKVPRLVKLFARRLQIQERLTTQVAETIQEKLNPRGVAVATRASHLCMMMRGVEETEATVLSTVFLGAFEKDATLRREFLDAVGNARAQAAHLAAG